MSNDFSQSEVLINENDSIVQKFLNGDEKITIELYLLRRNKNLKNEYEAKELTLNDDIISFLSRILKSNFKDLCKENKFQVSPYNDEFHLNEKLAYFKMDENEDLKNKFSKMLTSMSNEKLKIKNASFQFIKLIDSSKDKACYICYYQGVKKVSSNKVLGIYEKTSYRIVDEDLVNLGGFLDFIIDEDKNIYIHKPMPFEWAFAYQDHINKKRDHNITEIVKQDIFSDDNSKKLFEEEAQKYIRSRSMASMDDELINNLKEHFDERIEELIQIKEEMSDDKDYGIIGELFKFIDFEKKQIIIVDGNKDKLSPIFYLFQNKIVESFLTKEVRAALGYIK